MYIRNQILLPYFYLNVLGKTEWENMLKIIYMLSLESGHGFCARELYMIFRWESTNWRVWFITKILVCYYSNVSGRPFLQRKSITSKILTPSGFFSHYLTSKIQFVNSLKKKKLRLFSNNLKICINHADNYP